MKYIVVIKKSMKNNESFQRIYYSIIFDPKTSDLVTMISKTGFPSLFILAYYIRSFNFD